MDKKIVLNIAPGESGLHKIAAAFRRTFAGDDGEKVLEYLEKTCFENKSAFVPGDPQSSAFNEGRRTVLLDIKRLIKMEEK